MGLSGAFGGLLGASWASRGRLGGLWGHPGGVLRPKPRYLKFDSRLRAPSWARPGALLGRLRRLLGRLGSSWSGLGGLLGDLRASESRKGEQAKNLGKHT